MIFEDGVIRTPDLKFNEKCGGIGKLLFDSCKKYQDRIAVINTVTEEWDTYAGLLDKCIATASALRKRGLRPQNVIALCSNKENINANVPLIAAQFLGCISFSVHPSHTVEECVELFEQVPPKIVFTTAQSKDVISRALDRLGIKAEVIVFGEQFRKEFLENKEEFLPIHVEDLSTTSMIHFSSGTTGTPKAICLTHYYLLALQFWQTFGAKVVRPNLHQLNNHPLGSVSMKYSGWYWISTTLDLVISILIGGCRLLRDQFDTQEFWRNIDKYRVTDVYLLPWECMALIESVKPKDVDVSSLLKIATGSYILHTDFINKLKEIFPHVTISQIYGMTECGEVTSFNSYNPKAKELLSLKPQSCGMPVDGLHYKVIDVDTGKKCGPNQKGELYVKGKKVFRCFYNKDASVSFDEEGFFKSGDLVYFDEDLCFYILDRIKNIIKWDGHTIYLYQIEKVLLSHPAVNNAVVIGIPHKREGKRMMGVVQAKKDAEIVTEEELVNYVDQRVEDRKRMIFEDGVIRTPDLKFNEKCGGIGKLLFDSCKKYQDRIAVINTVTEEWDTYAGLLDKCIATASALRKRGLRPQNIIALCSNKENINANVPLIAAQFLGCVTFSVDPCHTVEECAEFFEQVPPKIVFTTVQSKDVISRALDRLGIKAEVIVFGEQFRKEFLENKEEFLPIHVEDLSTTSMIHFSSGSTGTPKAICLTHYYLLTLQFCQTFGATVVGPNHHQFNNHPLGSVSMKYTNWYWVSSTMDLVINFLVGGCRLLRDQFDPQEFWRNIGKYRVTDVFLMPLQCVELSESVKPEGLDVSSLFRITTGSYILHTDFINKLKKILPHVIISQLYGMTECGEVTSFNSYNPKAKELLSLKPQSCGMPVDGLHYKVIDVDSGKKCGPNQEGELYLKGKKVFRCFYNKDASVSFDKEGFFKSGDLVYFDEDLCFYILDRIKNVLRWNDRFVFLYHVEKELLSHPAVNNAVVIGIPHKREGERMMGVVQVKKDAEIVTEEELVNYVNQRVEDHKRLREGITFVDNFPTTITGKVNRLKLKQMILQNLKT